VWCARGSQGLQADWLKPNERGGSASTGETPYQRNQRETVAKFSGGLVSKPPPAANNPTVRDVIDATAIAARVG
jgi:hypothetical protein